MVPLEPDHPVVIGRSRPSDLPIRDGSLSRQHARFELLEDAVWVEDLGSTNGTRVNGKKIHRAKLRLDDEVSLGGVTVSVHVLAPAASEPLGIEGHDRFMQALEDELVRSRTFGRGLALLMVQTAKPQDGHLSVWCPRVRQLLRPVDRIALYGPSTVLIALPEVGQAEAVRLAQATVERRDKREPALICGLALYPGSAASAEELLAQARLAVQGARASQPVRLAEVASPALAAEQVGDGPVVLDPEMKRVAETALRLGDSVIPVLIQGETGTGKEVVARMIHEAGRRRRGPLRCINCGAIPQQLIESVLFGHEKGAFTGAVSQSKGLFEEADKGTVLLDEVGELSLATQAALLRVIESKRLSRVGSTKELEVDVRVLAATHRDLEEMCERGTFRWDLFYRLNTMTVRLPPLRERASEVLPLARHFMALANAANGRRIQRIDAAAEALLQGYSWPGNVRELRNVIERAVVIAQDGVIGVDDLSERVRKATEPRGGPALEPVDSAAVDLKAKLKRYEAQLILDALQAHGWNQTDTAKALDMPLRTLVRKIQLLGIRKKYEPGSGGA
ncbi:MAG: sigma 54-interacting transcriptional regulator [Deltaproteobacteria bacterium]|nr:sigma 54-interacting transcriptional regulator [Deltaproteobacteria bacterium]